MNNKSDYLQTYLVVAAVFELIEIFGAVRTGWVAIDHINDVVKLIHARKIDDKVTIERPTKQFRSLWIVFLLLLALSR